MCRRLDSKIRKFILGEIIEMSSTLFKTASYVYHQFLNPLTCDGLLLNNQTCERYENLTHNNLGVADGVPRELIIKRTTYIKDGDTMLFGGKVKFKLACHSHSV